MFFFFFFICGSTHTTLCIILFSYACTTMIILLDDRSLLFRLRVKINALRSLRERLLLLLPIFFFRSKRTFFVPAKSGSMFCTFVPYRSEHNLYTNERGLIGLFRYRHPTRLKSNRIYLLHRVFQQLTIQLGFIILYVPPARLG